MNRPVTDVVRPDLMGIAPYVPGKPIETMLRETGVREILKFASNENPLGPSPRAIAAARDAAENLHRYADAGAVALREALASRLAVSAAQVIPTCGSNELILLACQAVLRPGDEVVMHDPSFLMYPIAVQSFGGRSVRVRRDDLGIHLDAMLEAVSERTRMVIVCSPNNPTGDIVAFDALAAFVAALPPHVLVAVDEAYYEFVDDPSYGTAIPLLARHPDRAIVVMRTFSKVHALASLRVGYGVTHPELVSVFDRIRQPFNVNGVAQAAALASLDDPEQVRRSVALVREQRDPLDTGLRELGADVRRGHGNFVFCRFPMDMRPVCSALEKHGIVLRPLQPFGLTPDYVRITYGTAEENRRLLAGLRDVLAALPAASGRA
jgi:histidinol-phosphate aminotransferase